MVQVIIHETSGIILLCCRAIRTQKFLEFTVDDLQARKAKEQQIYQQLMTKHTKVVSKQELDAFYARLQVITECHATSHGYHMGIISDYCDA